MPSHRVGLPLPQDELMVRPGIIIRKPLLHDASAKRLHRPIVPLCGKAAHCACVKSFARTVEPDGEATWITLWITMATTLFRRQVVAH